MTDVRLSESWVAWGESGGVLTKGDASVSFRISRTGEDELETFRQEVARVSVEGTSLSSAVDVANEALPVISGRRVLTTAAGVVLVDDTATVTVDGAVATLKIVVQLAGPESRVVMVSGGYHFEESSDYDSLNAFGALIIRLNVDQFFAVGPAARGLFLSVGSEGSWDGESRHCADVGSAYDEIRAFIQPGDVVVVMGTNSVDLAPLVSQLSEVDA